MLGNWSNLKRTHNAYGSAHLLSRWFGVGVVRVDPETTRLSRREMRPPHESVFHPLGPTYVAGWRVPAPRDSR